MRSDCGRVDNGRFGRLSPGRDGNPEDMALRRMALTLVALLGSAAVGDGKFGAELLSRCVFTVWASPVVAVGRHGARIWLTLIKLARSSNGPRRSGRTSARSILFVWVRLPGFDG